MSRILSNIPIKIKIEGITKDVAEFIRDEALELFNENLLSTFSQSGLVDRLVIKRDLSIIQDVHKLFSAYRFRVLKDNKGTSISLKCHEAVLLNDCLVYFSTNIDSDSLRLSISYTIRNQITPKLI